MKTLLMLIPVFFCALMHGNEIFRLDFRNGQINAVGGTVAVIKSGSVENTVEDHALLTRIKDEKKERGGFRIRFLSPGNSPDGMVRNGTIDGAIDFFVRYNRAIDANSPIGVFRVIDFGSPKDGMRLALYNSGARKNMRGELWLDLFCSDPVFKGENGKMTKILRKSANYILKPDVLYHFALLFETTKEKKLVISLYAAENGAEIAYASAKPLLRMTAELPPEKLAKGFQCRPVIHSFTVVSAPGFGGLERRVGRFVIYDQIPPVFPGI